MLKLIYFNQKRAEKMDNKGLDKISSLRAKLAKVELKMAELQAEANDYKRQISLLEEGAFMLAVRDLMKDNPELQKTVAERVQLLGLTTPKAIEKRLAAAAKESKKAAGATATVSTGKRGRPPKIANDLFNAGGKTAAA